MNQLFNIQGNSGCQLDVRRIDGRLNVIKSCKDDYVERLHKQYQKQVSDTAVSGRIKVPEATWDPDSSSIVMDYVHADSYASFMEKASYNDLINFAKSLSSYINNEANGCIVKRPLDEIFISKMESVIDNMRKKLVFATMTDYERHLVAISVLEEAFSTVKDLLLTMPENSALPIGRCHGDLTMSNILFTNDSYYLIDYLDSYIETPVQDIVKIRQDTRLHWSQLMTDNTARYNWTHINVAMDFVDRMVMDDLKDMLDECGSYYTVLEIINLARIFPYAKNTTVLDWLISTMTKLIDL